ncbi:MAG: hypothetical protein ACLFV6_08185 [Spirulinaceae cyanobacterium]
MEYIYCFPFISLSLPETTLSITPATVHSLPSTSTAREKQPSLNTSEMLVRFS